jgi:hypothetical protein
MKKTQLDNEPEDDSPKVMLVTLEQSINSDDSKPLREYPNDDDDRVSVSSYNTVRTR